MTLVEKRADVGQLELNHAEGMPSGPPFVLLHGGSARWQYGETMLKARAERWHVYAPDLRGHGRSDRASGRYRLLDYAVDVAVLLERVVGEPAVLYGHSLGGQVAVVAATRAPAVVRAVIVGNAPLSPEDSPVRSPAHQAVVASWRHLAVSGAPPDAITRALRAMPVEVPDSDEAVPAA